jgi:hypothetical protein
MYQLHKEHIELDLVQCNFCTFDNNLNKKFLIDICHQGKKCINLPHRKWHSLQDMVYRKIQKDTCQGSKMNIGLKLDLCMSDIMNYTSNKLMQLYSFQYGIMSMSLNFLLRILCRLGDMVSKQVLHKFLVSMQSIVLKYT